MRRMIAGRLLMRTILALTTLGLAACGNDAGLTGSGGAKSADAKGAGGGAAAEGPKNKNAEPPPGDKNPATPPPFASLTWFWQCDSDLVTAPAPKTDKDVVVEGIGPHDLNRDRLRGTPVTVSGHVCPPAQLPRDIVFVIDVSGSMKDNDPRIGDSCGRLTAIQSVIAAVPAGSTKFGLTTFNSLQDQTTTGLFDTEAELFANIAPAGNIADVVCKATIDPGQGGTNYDAGLTQAGVLLQLGRDNATKEIYFVSDGQPDGGKEGLAIADSLKNTGVAIGTDSITVTIATVMLKGNDRVLQDQIASRDAKGQPLYAFVANTSQLTEVLTKLAANDIAGGDVKYRPIGAVNYTTLTLMDHLQGFNFTLPSFNIDIDKAPVGLELLFEYFDQHDNRYSTGGKLLWVTDGASGS